MFTELGLWFGPRSVALFIAACLCQPMFGHAQDMKAVAVDLAERTLKTYCPRTKARNMTASEVFARFHGDVCHTLVRFDLDRGVRRLLGKPRSAEVRASFVVLPNRRTLIYLDYTDGRNGWLPKMDHTARIIANYNMELERSMHMGRFVTWPASSGAPLGENEDAPPLPESVSAPQHKKQREKDGDEPIPVQEGVVQMAQPLLDSPEADSTTKASRAAKQQTGSKRQEKLATGAAEK